MSDHIGSAHHHSKTAADDEEIDKTAGGTRRIENDNDDDEDTDNQVDASHDDAYAHDEAPHNAERTEVRHEDSDG